MKIMREFNGFVLVVGKRVSDHSSIWALSSIFFIIIVHNLYFYIVAVPVYFHDDINSPSILNLLDYKRTPTVVAMIHHSIIFITFHHNFYIVKHAVDQILVFYAVFGVCIHEGY